MDGSEASRRAAARVHGAAVCGHGLGMASEERRPPPPPRGRSRHIVLLRGWIVAGPWSGHEHATGASVVGLFGATGLLFALSFKYVARGIWVDIAPFLYVGCWLVLYSAAYIDPGVLPRRWQLPPPNEQVVTQPVALRAATTSNGRFSSPNHPRQTVPVSL